MSRTADSCFGPVQVEFARLAPLARAAAAEHVSLKQGRDEQWFAIFDGREPVAVGAVIWLAKDRTKARIKGIYTVPAYRGQGLGERLTRGLIDAAGDARLEAISPHARFYETLGWTRSTEIRPGSWRWIRQP